VYDVCKAISRDETVKCIPEREEIGNVEEFPFLGVTLDYSLTFKSHVKCCVYIQLFFHVFTIVLIVGYS